MIPRTQDSPDYHGGNEHYGSHRRPQGAARALLFIQLVHRNAPPTLLGGVHREAFVFDARPRRAKEEDSADEPQQGAC